MKKTKATTNNRRFSFSVDTVHYDDDNDAMPTKSEA